MDKSCIFKEKNIEPSKPHIRPRFSIVIPRTQEELMERLNSLVENPPKDIEGKLVDNHIILDIVQEYQHYWSPQLNFRIEQDELNENESVVTGIIGPKPAVWTMFMFIYFLIGMTGFIISSYGVSKWLMGEYSNWLLAFPVALLIMLSAFKIGKYGESLAKDQIELLKQFVRDAIYY